MVKNGIYFIIGILIVYTFSPQAFAECIRKTPMVGVGPGYQYSAPGQVAHLTVYFFNNDSAECGYSTFVLSGTDLNDGADVIFESPNQIVQAGGLNFVPLTVNVHTDAVLGEHLIRIETWDLNEIGEHNKFTTAVVYLK